MCSLSRSKMSWTMRTPRGALAGSRGSRSASSGRHGTSFRYPDDLAAVPLLLPSRDSDIRTAFDLICEQQGVRVIVAGEVDDMAMLRLLARDGDAVALVPAVVMIDELRSGILEEYATVPHLCEKFDAIGVRGQYQHARVPPLLEQAAATLSAWW